MQAQRWSSMQATPLSMCLQFGLIAASLSAGVQFLVGEGSVGDRDSLFTLTSAQITGLMVVNVLVGALVLFMSIMATRYLRQANTVALRFGFISALSALLYFAFVWLSPQVYYLYYQTIIPGLPAQWVIKSLPETIFTATESLAMGPHGSLSDHSKGWLGRFLLFSSLAYGLQHPSATSLLSVFVFGQAVVSLTILLV